MLIQFECDGIKAAEAIDAIRQYAKGRIVMLAPQSLPRSPMLENQFEKRAQEIATAIRPRRNQPMRRETLQLVLGGGDTFFDQGGDPDPALRNATGALSKSLKRFEPYWDSPLEIIAARKREVFADGAMKGKYRGTRYIPTKLGLRVREILREWKAL